MPPLCLLAKSAGAHASPREHAAVGKKIPTGELVGILKWWCVGSRRQTAYELLMQANVGRCGLAWLRRVFIGWGRFLRRRRSPLSLFSSIPRFSTEPASALTFPHGRFRPQLNSGPFFSGKRGRLIFLPNGAHGISILCSAPVA